MHLRICEAVTCVLLAVPQHAAGQAIQLRLREALQRCRVRAQLGPGRVGAQCPAPPPLAHHRCCCGREFVVREFLPAGSRQLQGAWLNLSEAQGGPNAALPESSTRAHQPTRQSGWAAVGPPPCCLCLHRRLAAPEPRPSLGVATSGEARLPPSERDATCTPLRMARCSAAASRTSQ